jgi:hypothetical protein
MVHPDAHIWLETGYRRQNVIQDLLRSRRELAAPRAHLIPAFLISVIELLRILAADRDYVALVGQIHIISIACFSIKVFLMSS